MMGRVRAFGRFLAGLQAFLDTPISYEQAQATIHERQRARNRNFLAMMRGCVYGNPRSPYLPLLRAAGCEYGDLAAQLVTDPLERLLTRLAETGVRVTLGQFKGRAPMVAGGREYAVAAADFDNVVLRRGAEFTTGGSTGRPSRALIELDFLADRACYEHVMFRMLDLGRVPFALWYPKLPMSVGLLNALRYAKTGNGIDRWFDMAIGSRVLGPWHSWALAATIAVSRRSRAPLPWPQAAPLTRPDRVIDWMADARRRHGRCAVQSHVSGVLRLVHAAARRGMDLSRVQFVTGSEPLTPGRRDTIVSSGAAVYERYYAVDLGSIAAGCGAAGGAGHLHLLSDTVTAVAGGAPSPGDGAVPLLFTSVLDRGPRVALNVDLGDRAVMTGRRCGCLYDELGLAVQLSRVRSASRSTVEGMALPYADLVEISERVLPALLGASPLDFQWGEAGEAPPQTAEAHFASQRYSRTTPSASSSTSSRGEREAEDLLQSSRSGPWKTSSASLENGLVRIWLRISPEVGAIDEAAVRAAVFEGLARTGGAGRFYARLLEAAGSLRIVRERPHALASGKTPPVMPGPGAGEDAASEARRD